MTQSLVGDSSGRRYGLGDPLAVKLVDVQPSLGRLDLQLGARPGARQRDSPKGKRGARDGRGAKRSRR